MGERHYSPAEVSRLLGVSPKALRLYEARGLVTAVRTSNGWRAYGRAEIARLTQVLALKALRLPLARIAELLKGDGVSLDQVLAAHETALAAEADKATRALGLVRAARVKLAAGQALSIDDLATLAKETTMPLKSITADLGPLMKPLIAKHFTEAEIDEVKRNAQPYDRDAVAKEWDQLFVEVRRLMESGDSTSPEAMAVARRWRAAANAFSAHPEMKAKAQAVWADAMADPELAPRLPIDDSVFAFVRKIVQQTGEG
jgi:DNA-binding transcriptional MerR regulator